VACFRGRASVLNLLTRIKEIPVRLIRLHDSLRDRSKQDETAWALSHKKGLIAIDAGFSRFEWIDCLKKVMSVIFPGYGLFPGP
jgi:hypothetical protein